MANLIYATIKGKKQGLISAGCSTFYLIGNNYQSGHADEILVLSFDHEITRTMNVNHRPVSFVKPIDKSSPLLGVAISNNQPEELISVKYASITWQHHIAGTSGYSFWEDRLY
ncbi:type VI secretion system tube protein Hcp [Xenorhabdus bovienii]|uniref:type VI secretion system tube protein TssD n=1 Tax=Xenorhabdus bovienii TaxID=40576 RepID=UPI001EDD9387|nr:type VI secretion system tube protein TssD [Xenorhabdus bovienii]MCG3463369.1 type VI secretion system tube protein Hcp [Xenorhabdus bovienii]